MKQLLKNQIKRLFQSRAIQFSLRKIKFIILRYPLAKRAIVLFLSLTPKLRANLEQIWISTEKQHANNAKTRINYLHRLSSQDVLLPLARDISVHVEPEKSKKND